MGFVETVHTLLDTAERVIAFNCQRNGLQGTSTSIESRFEWLTYAEFLSLSLSLSVSLYFIIRELRLARNLFSSFLNQLVLIARREVFFSSDVKDVSFICHVAHTSLQTRVKRSTLY